MAGLASLVGYSGSDSDDPSDGETEKTEIIRTVKPDRHADTAVHRQHGGDGRSTETAELSIVFSGKISTLQSDMVSTLSNLDTDEEPHSKSSEEEVGNKSVTNDFFGIDNSSDSDDSNNDTGHFVKGGNIWIKSLNSSGALKHSAKGKLRPKSNIEPKELPHVDLGLYGNQNKFALPVSQFWTATSKVDDWTNPNRIWSGSKSNQRQLISEERESEPSEWPSKRQKVAEQTGQNDQQRQETTPLQKNCFYVHHKISPALHQKVPCYPPTRKFVCLKGHVGAVNRVKWSTPEFSHLIASASMDNTVKIWNIFSTISHCVQTLYCHTKAVKDITWSPSGKEVLSCGYDRTARLNDVVKGAEISKFEHRDFLTCVAYHPVNPNVFLAGSKDKVLCWDVRCPESCMKVFEYKHSFGQVQDLVFIQEGHEFVISTDLVSRDSADRSIMVYDFRSGVVLSNQVYQERYTCTRLGVHPDNSEIMAQSSGDYIALFSTIRPYKMNRCKRFSGHKVLGYAVGCCYSSDGRFVASGNAESKVTIWDYERALSVKQLGDPKEIYLDVAWHPLLRSTVASSTWGGHIDVWQ